MQSTAPVRTDIVLVGGGHAHVHVLTAFAMRPEPGVRLTLVTRDLETPYSGMLPGLIAGLYTHDEAHIDLARLAAATGARLIHAEAIGLDRANKRVLLSGRPPLAYALVSLDVGIAPALDAIPGAAEHGIVVKPIGSFLVKFDALLARCREPGGPRRIAVVGGGAGGVGPSLSVRARLHAEIGQDAGFSFALATAGGIMQSHSERGRKIFRRVFAERGIALHECRKVRALTCGMIALESGPTIYVDTVLVTTEAAPPAWLERDH